MSVALTAAEHVAVHAPSMPGRAATRRSSRTSSAALGRASEFRFTKNGVERAQRGVLTDGGVFDDLGTKVLEPGRDAWFTVTYDVDYIIVRDAGRGLLADGYIPYAFPSRLRLVRVDLLCKAKTASAPPVHAQGLRRAKGFVMPYLGQQEYELPVVPVALPLRAEVADYPTDFAAMSEETIELLAVRGDPPSHRRPVSGAARDRRGRDRRRRARPTRRRLTSCGLAATCRARARRSAYARAARGRPRRQPLTLTEQGQWALRSAQTTVRERLVGLLADLPPPEADALARLLERLQASLSGTPPPPRPHRPPPPGHRPKHRKHP